MSAYGFTLNTQPASIRVRMLKERRDHLETQIDQILDAIYVIDCELRERGDAG